MNEEAKLRAKYGGALPRQQNMLLTKKLMNKVKKKFLERISCQQSGLFFQPRYFDSGDYNVAKSQGKLAESKPDSASKTTSTTEPTTPIVPETITGHEIPTPETVLPRKLSCVATMMPPSTMSSNSMSTSSFQ